MKVGDKVKVVRIDNYTREYLEAENIPLPIGKVGIVQQVEYNPNMHQTEITVNHQGDLYIWEEWNLALVAKQ